MSCTANPLVQQRFIGLDRCHQHGFFKPVKHHHATYGRQIRECFTLPRHSLYATCQRQKRRSIIATGRVCHISRHVVTIGREGNAEILTGSVGCGKEHSGNSVKVINRLQLARFVIILIGIFGNSLTQTVNHAKHLVGACAYVGQGFSQPGFACNLHS